MVSLAPKPAFDPLILLFLALAIEGICRRGRRSFFAASNIPSPSSAAFIGFFDDKLNPPQTIRKSIGLFVVRLAWSSSWYPGQLGDRSWCRCDVADVACHVTWGWVVEAGAARHHVRSTGADCMTPWHASPTGLETLADLEGGRAAVRHIVGRDPEQLGCASRRVGPPSKALAENFCPTPWSRLCFWYVLLGAPGILVYKTVNTMDSMIGHKTPRHRAFGFTAARLDDALNAIPARLSAVFIALAALFVPSTNPKAALRTAWRDAGKHRSFNAGWPEAAMAGALGLALAGPRTYLGGVVDDHWMGDGRARVNDRDIRRALYVYGVACLIVAGTVGAIAAVRLQL